MLLTGSMPGAGATLVPEPQEAQGTPAHCPPWSPYCPDSSWQTSPGTMMLNQAQCCAGAVSATPASENPLRIPLISSPKRAPLSHFSCGNITPGPELQGPAGKCWLIDSDRLFQQKILPLRITDGEMTCGNFLTKEHWAQAARPYSAENHFQWNPQRRLFTVLSFHLSCHQTFPSLTV